MHKLISLVFVGILTENIIGRLQGITYFKFSDVFVSGAIIIFATITIFKSDIDIKINNARISWRNRNKTF